MFLKFRKVTISRFTPTDRRIRRNSHQRLVNSLSGTTYWVFWQPFDVARWAIKNFIRDAASNMVVVSLCCQVTYNISRTNAWLGSRRMRPTVDKHYLSPDIKALLPRCFFTGKCADLSSNCRCAAVVCGEVNANENRVRKWRATWWGHDNIYGKNVFLAPSDAIAEREVSLGAELSRSVRK